MGDLPLASLGPWSMEPGAAVAVSGFLARTVDAQVIAEARSGGVGGRIREFRVEGRTAVIPISGPIFTRSSFITQLLGFAAYNEIRSMLAAANADDGVESVRLEFDSPGGMVGGVQETAQAIRESPKPVSGHVGGMCASAAYWLASACSDVSAEPTATVGGLGVIVSLQEDGEGVKTVVSSQTPAKRVSPETAQEVVDDMAAIFLADVAAGRGVAVDSVAEKFGAGRILIASKALAAGMIDSTTAPGGGRGAIMENVQLPKAEHDALLAASVERDTLRAELDGMAKGGGASVEASVAAAVQPLEAKVAELTDKNETLVADAYLAKRSETLGVMVARGQITPGEALVATAEERAENETDGPAVEAYDAQHLHAVNRLFSTIFEARAEGSQIDTVEHGHQGGEKLDTEPGQQRAKAKSESAYAAAHGHSAAEVAELIDVHAKAQGIAFPVAAVKIGNMSERARLALFVELKNKGG